jgi:hypothetical protein
MIGRCVLVFVLLCVMGIALRAAVTAQFGIAQPERAAWAVPASGNAMVVLAAQRIIAGGGLVDDPAQALISAAMARAPAAGQPLALAGLAASAEGDLPRATRLMEAARDRAPRAPLARNWLLNAYVRAARYDAALVEAGVLMRLTPETRPQTYALIRAMTARADSAPAVARALARSPDWAEPYAAWASAQGRPGGTP